MTKEVLARLLQSEVYKEVVWAATARIAAGEDSQAVGREVLETTLSKPMQGGDREDACYAVEAFMIGAFDPYYLDVWNSATGEMQELVESVLSAVENGEMTPRRAAEKWAATHLLRDRGYPAPEVQFGVALDVIYERIQWSQMDAEMHRRC